MTTEIPNKQVFSIEEFCRSFGIGKTRTYAEIKAGRLRAIKCGARTLITTEAAKDWLAQLPTARTKELATS